MSKREPSVLLDDIRTSIEKIQRYTAGLDEALLADEKTTDAVARNLEIIGEAAKQLPAEFESLHPANSMAANSRLAQPHRARLCRSRSETVWNILANSDSEVGPSDRRVEITTIERVHDSQSTRASSFRTSVSSAVTFFAFRKHRCPSVSTRVSPN
jgi:uncharacterized protein with HEPN domain